MSQDNGKNQKPLEAPAPTVLDVEQLDELSKPTPAAPSNLIRLLSSCHEAPLMIQYVHKAGRVGLQCAWCGRISTELQLGRSSILHLPRRNNGALGGG